MKPSFGNSLYKIFKIKEKRERDEKQKEEKEKKKKDKDYNSNKNLRIEINVDNINHIKNNISNVRKYNNRNNVVNIAKKKWKL